jgi:hypothetical protein
MEEGSGWSLAGAAAGVAVLPILGRLSASWDVASLPFDERRSAVPPRRVPGRGTHVEGEQAEPEDHAQGRKDHRDECDRT